MATRLTIGLLACLMLATAAQAQRNQLKVGHDAPGLDIEKWINTPEVTIQPGRNHLIYFWSLECQDCRAGLSVLMAFHEVYGDQFLRIIAINSDDEVADVERLVRRNEMEFAVAADRRSSTRRAWVDAADKDREDGGHMFLVNHEGKVAHISKPTDEFFIEKVLDRFMAWRYDEVAFLKGLPIYRAAQNARQLRNWSQASLHYENVIELEPRVFPDVALEKFEMLIVDKIDTEGAYKYVNETLAGGYYKDDAVALGMIAEFIATEPKIADKDRDMDLALELAEKGAKLAAPQNRPLLLTNLAAVKYRRGALDDAIKLQREAYFQGRKYQKDHLKRRLQEYAEARKKAR